MRSLRPLRPPVSERITLALMMCLLVCLGALLWIGASPRSLEIVYMGNDKMICNEHQECLHAGDALRSGKVNFDGE